MNLIEPAQPGACHVIPLDPKQRVEVIVLKEGVHVIVVQDEIDVARLDQGPNLWPS